jgi:hypothetical protein
MIDTLKIVVPGVLSPIETRIEITELENNWQASGYRGRI